MPVKTSAPSHLFDTNLQKKTLLVHVCKRLVKENITDLKSLFSILVTRLLLAVLDIIGSYGKFWAKEGL
jgi:hypothetical protein